ncbi:hypothetical protein [Lysinibacillus xylanilyticus]|uniref:hypothetical protein n=1 Tax=Lysinibacillus xylanilyticus TaxID=582475 RepID=UPI00381C4AA2
MNIFKLKIRFKHKKKESSTNIITTIQSIYSGRYSNSDGYLNFIQEKWDKLKYENIKAIYEKDQIIARTEFDNCEYYIIKENNNNDRSNVLLTTLIFTKENNPSKIINSVVKNINTILKEGKIKSTIPNNGDIVLYLFDTKTNDIVAYHNVINYLVENFVKLNKREVSLIIIMIIFIIVLIVYPGDIFVDGVKSSLIGSAIFMILTTIITNFNFTKSIVLKDLPQLYDLNFEISSEEVEKIHKALSVGNTPNIPDIPDVPDIPDIPQNMSTQDVSQKTEDPELQVSIKE